MDDARSVDAAVLSRPALGSGVRSAGKLDVGERFGSWPDPGVSGDQSDSEGAWSRRSVRGSTAGARVARQRERVSRRSVKTKSGR